ncbi:MAG TPA: type II toxin-antitoxin system VapC family toxin [Rhizobacter sp.]|nr:type II toxin-antitoxin system VapC family toxin [Rhizobacter sp.]
MSVSRILLDTNVLSELMRSRPEPVVLDWFAAQGPQTRFLISAITQAEILLGVALMPTGKKRSALADVAQAMFEQEFHGLNLAFDEQVAPIYAAIVAQRSRSGQPISVEDAQIAATAAHHRVPLATRNTKDFAHVPDLVLINPWKADVT